MKKRLVCCAFLALLALSGCGNTANQDTPVSQEVQAMDTVMTLTAYGENADAALLAATEEIHRLDALLSVSHPGGDIHSLNATKQVDLAPDTHALLEQAIAISAETGGAFDCTIAPLMDAWGFSDKNYHVPDDITIRSLLPSVDASAIRLDETGHCILPERTKVDLGGIAKGYTAERVMEIFSQKGVESALISLGGNVQTLDSKPDGAPWTIGIQDPFAPENIIAKLQIHQGAVVTSGGYLRYFEENGTRYHHILDPHTGTPAASGLASVSIVSKDGTLADALSTALFVMGEEEAVRYWQAHKNDFDCILVTTEGRVLVTPNIASATSLIGGNKAEVIA